MTSPFIDALLDAEIPVIMEVKARSASGTDLTGGRDLAGIVAEYEAADAPCLSVVTGKWFGGHPDMLREVRQHTSLPILQKDFITSERGLLRARELGASAVLLTAQLLTTSSLVRLIGLSLRHGLTPFVEVISQAEIDAVRAAAERPADVIVAVNNKNIKEKEAGPPDLSRSLSLLPAIRSAGIRCPVSASGIDTPEAAAKLLDAGYAGLLIGTGLLQSGSPRTWAAALSEPRIAWRKQGYSNTFATQSSGPPSVRAALGTVRVLSLDERIAPGDVAAHFARNFAGVPATSHARPEEVVRYGNVEGSRLPVLLGLYGDAGRVRGWLPGLPREANPESAARLLAAALEPAAVGAAPSQETRIDVDLGALPVLTATPRDAGPYITTGLVCTGTAASVHRMLVTGRDRLTIWMVPGRQLRARHESAVAGGTRLPVSVNIGPPPAAMVASALNTRFLPPGVTKLGVAGALAGAPVTLAPALSQPVQVLAEAEIVLEGYLDDTVAPEGQGDVSLPEFLGYDGPAQPELPVLTVTAITMRRNAAYQGVIGPGREQSVILGLAGALSAALSVTDPMIRDLHYLVAGGGMLTLAIKVAKRGPEDDARLEPVARQIFEQHPFTKLIIFTDEDIDIACAEDLLWALTTRSNLGADCTTLAGFAPLAMDPSQRDEWRGKPGRVFVDATVPYALRRRTARSFG